MTNLKICKCGNCQTAYERAFAITQKMYGDNECSSFQIAVAAAFYTLAVAGIRDSILRQAKEEGLNVLPEFVLKDSTKFNVAILCEQVHPYLTEHNADIISRIDKMNGDFYERIEADYEATKADQPNVGKPKT